MFRPGGAGLGTTGDTAPLGPKSLRQSARSREPVGSRNAAGISDADLCDGILESLTCGLACPDEDFRIDCQHHSDNRVTP